MVEMELVAVRIELPGNTPVVLLRETSGPGRLLPIFIGQPEATAIAFAIDGVLTPRPMTHDLMKNLLDQLHATVDRVVVTELSDGTFYAEIHVADTTGRPHRISSRPSDAIALALRVECPIFAEDDVLAEAGLVDDQDGEGEEPEEVVEKFREFIDTVNPDDFAS
jgi:bifunctional DNase/RNase